MSYNYEMLEIIYSCCCDIDLIASLSHDSHLLSVWQMINISQIAERTRI